MCKIETLEAHLLRLAIMRTRVGICWSTKTHMRMDVEYIIVYSCKSECIS